MEKPKQMLPQDLATIVARRFKILERLYPSNELTLTQLSEELNLDLGNLSRYAHRLKNAGLVDIRKNETTKNEKPSNLCSLTYLGRKILDSLFEAQDRNKGPSPGEIDASIDMLQDKTLSPDFHEFIASKLADQAIGNAKALISRDRIKALLEQTVLHPISDSDKIGKHLMSCLANSIPKVLTEEKTRDWFFTKIYKPLLDKTTGEKETLRTKEWALKNLSRVARLTNRSDLRREIIERLLKVYFEESVELSRIAKDELSNFEPQFREEIMKRTRKSFAEKPENRAKAEALLKGLVSSWWQWRSITQNIV